MGKININEADNYTSTNGSYFSLSDHGDTAKVRFMYNDIDDVSLDVVHEIEVNGKQRNVNCLRSYDEPIDNCPLCRAGMKQKVKLFIPLYNIGKKEVQVWSRGKTWVNQLTSLCQRYKPLCSTPFEIERQGKKGDQTTKYQLFPGQKDDTTLDDLPELPDLSSGIIMDKTYDELAYFVENGTFEGDTKKENTTTEVVKRRRAF